MAYIISQIAASAALICLGVSYLTKNYKHITLLCVFASVFLALQFLLLEAYAAAAQNIIGIFVNLFFYFNRVKERKIPLWFILLILLCRIGFGLIDVSGYINIIVILASVIFFISICQKNVLVYRFLGVIVSILCTYYNIYYRTIVGVIMQIFLFIISLIGLITLLVSRHKNKKEANLQNL